MNRYPKTGIALLAAAMVVLTGLGGTASSARADDKGSVRKPQNGSTQGKVIVPPGSTVIVQPTSKVIVPGGNVVVRPPAPYVTYYPSYTYAAPSPVWIQGYWAQQWVPQYYTAQVWVPGYYSEEGVWYEGYYGTQTVQSGYYQTVWIPGYWAR